MERDTLERLATLVVEVGANVRPDQIVSIQSEIGKEELTRAVAAHAYQRGARFVDVVYFDPWVKRVRIEHAREETLGFVPSWYGERMLALGRQRCARIGLTGPASPEALPGLDPARVGRDQLPVVPELHTLINERTTNWTGAPAPTPGWARLVHPGLEPEDALARLWEEVAYACRLDEPDPVEAWLTRVAALEDAATRLTARRFDALHFEGPGTDLTVGLLPSSRWVTARFETVDGIGHLANLPTEEVFTCPDPERTEGVARATKPLVFHDGAVVRGLVLRFEGGRATEVDAESGVEALRGRAALDEGAARLGEVALVDREGRIGRLGTAFFETLLDENAASHIALGNGFDFALDEADRARRNRSDIHVDFMFGGDDVEVTGVTAEGALVPVIRGGAWQV